MASMSNQKQTKNSTMSSAVFDSLSSTAASSQLLVPYKDTDTPSTTGESPAENLKSDYNNDPRPSTRLKIKRHSPKARIPTGGSAQASGYDLYSAEEKVVPAKGRAVIDTQLSIGLPHGSYGRIAARSGLAWKFGIDTGAGVIDGDYRGILYVVLFNHGEEDFQVSEGDRIAQLIIERIYTPEICEVQELEETIRGDSGFGSTGGHVGL